jgi:hypothetical protein
MWSATADRALHAGVVVELAQTTNTYTVHRKQVGVEIGREQQGNI